MKGKRKAMYNEVKGITVTRLMNVKSVYFASSYQ